LVERRWGCGFCRDCLACGRSGSGCDGLEKRERERRHCRPCLQSCAAPTAARALNFQESLLFYRRLHPTLHCTILPIPVQPPTVSPSINLDDDVTQTSSPPSLSIDRRTPSKYRGSRPSGRGTDHRRRRRRDDTLISLLAEVGELRVE
ncbi:hypothetical protein PFISCL1PPCAC_12402, partial [Pristionchus fissidentatus]